MKRDLCQRDVTWGQRTACTASGSTDRTSFSRDGPLKVRYGGSHQFHQRIDGCSALHLLPHLLTCLRCLIRQGLPPLNP